MINLLPNAALSPGGPHGRSPWADAWRRLRRDRAAFVSLCFLIAVVVLAVLTPMFPLQPPDADATALQYAAPTAAPFWLNGARQPLAFSLDREAIQQSTGLAETLRREIPPLRQSYRQARFAYEQAERSAPADLGQPQRERRLAERRRQRDQAWEAMYRKYAEFEDVIQSPYRRAGFPELGPLSRWMVRVRHALFGDGQINSLCGRDELGRDLLSQIFWGARVSLIVGLVATLVSLVIGVTYGAVAGYFGGWVDDVMMRLVDILYSIPFIFVVIFIITILNEESVARQLDYYGIGKITVFYFVVGAIYWLTMSRVVRGQVISLKNEPFVEAARSLGAGRSRIIFRHLLPNVFSVVLVYLTLTIPRVMLFEAFFSFIGLGVDRPDVSWGLLANEGIRVITPVRIYWWLVLFPSLALGSTLLALNFLGDGMRDALDPRLRDQPSAR
ncbi:MAG: ABC transporter permease [Planctomycetota bacterium]